MKKFAVSFLTVMLWFLAAAPGQPPAFAAEDEPLFEEGRFTVFEDDLFDKPDERMKSAKIIAPGELLEPRSARDFNENYSILSYRIGEKGQEEYYKRMLQSLCDSIANRFGNQSGTYTVTIEIKSKDGTVLSTAPIIVFQWEKKGILFFENLVKQVQATQWNGTLIDRLLVTEKTDRVTLSLKAYFKNTTTIEFSALRKLTDLFNEAHVAQFFPIPASTLGIVNSVEGILKLLFDGSREYDLTEGREISFLSKKVRTEPNCCVRTAVTNINLTVPVVGEIGKKLRVFVRIAIPRSRYKAFDERSGRFTSLPSTSILDTTGASFSGKATSLLQLLRASDDPADAASRPLLEGLLGGSGYAKEDLDQRCGGALGLSAPVCVRTGCKGALLGIRPKIFRANGKAAGVSGGRKVGGA